MGVHPARVVADRQQQQVMRILPAVEVVGDGGSNADLGHVRK